MRLEWGGSLIVYPGQKFTLNPLGPPEDCGGPFAFMALEDRYSLPYMFDIIEGIVAGELSRDDYWEELHEFQYLPCTRIGTIIGHRT